MVIHINTNIPRVKTGEWASAHYPLPAFEQRPITQPLGKWQEENVRFRTPLPRD